MAVRQQGEPVTTITGADEPVAVSAATVPSYTLRARYWEVDVLRGAAVAMMVVYHLMWDLWFFQVLSNAQFWNPFWKYWQSPLPVRSLSWWVCH